jgi:hypothetical protein
MMSICVTLTVVFESLENPIMLSNKDIGTRLFVSPRTGQTPVDARFSQAWHDLAHATRAESYSDASPGSSGSALLVAPGT